MSRLLHIAGVGLIAPGLVGWEDGRRLLGDATAEYVPGPLGSVVPSSLPANERRRTTATIRLAMRVAEEAMASVPDGTEGLSTVFVSDHGDMEVTDRICRAIASPEHPVSPTQFHNSVHNAPAAYCSIATAMRSPYTSISVGGVGFAGGLLEAAVTAWAEELPVLLVAYDLPGPHPISRVAPVTAPMAVALLLDPVRRKGGAGTLSLSSTNSGIPDSMVRPSLEALRNGNSAGHALSLLRAMARREARRVLLPYLAPAVLGVEYRP